MTMRFRLRTLLIVLALGPPLLAAYFRYRQLWLPIHEDGAIIAIWAVLTGCVCIVRNRGR